MIDRVANYPIDDWLDQALDQLIDECDIGAALFAFSKTIVDRPENFAKIADSYSGHAVHLQNRCVLNELQLWCCRIWEKNGNSLPNFAERIRGKGHEIATVRKRVHPDWPENQLELDIVVEQVESFCDEVEQAATDDFVVRLKVRRDEQFAHILRRAGARKKLEAMGVEEGYSLNEVFLHSESALRLIAEARRLLWFEVCNPVDRMKMLAKHYEAYWKYLPNLSEVEAIDLDKRIKKKRARDGF